MSEQNLNEDEAAEKGVNPETGVPDNRFHGTPQDPITEDYNTEHADEQAAEGEESDEVDESTPEEPEAVDATADGADAGAAGPYNTY